MSSLHDADLAREITLSALFQRSARLFANRVAAVDDDGRHTYAQIEGRARRIAAALPRGERIAVLSEPRREWLEMYIAAAYAGCTVVALNTRLHPDEIAWCLEKAAPKRVFHSPSLAELLEKSPIEEAISFDALESWLSNVEPLSELAPVRTADIHNVLFTSGTTGRPKGAMISHGAAATRALRLAQWFRLTPGDGFIGWLPLFHCGGDESFYASWLTGGRYATFPKANTLAMYERIQSDRLSWTLLLPGVINDFLNNPRRRDFDLRSMRFAIGYGNMMPQLVKELTATLGISFFDAFGQTETSYLLAHDEVAPGALPSLHKQPLPLMDVRIVDEQMNEQPIGVPGECVVRGPSVMSGYLDDAEANAEVFRGGWLHTGDILVRNDDGTISFTDRKKYLIKTGGENVYPAEVESALARLAAIEEACVLGIPDPQWGESIVAVIVLRPGQALTEAEVEAHCRAQLASFKRPRRVHFVGATDLPRSTTGKVLRHELAAAVAGGRFG